MNEQPETRLKKILTGLNDAKVKIGVTRQRLQEVKEQLKKLGLEPNQVEDKLKELEIKKTRVGKKLEIKLDEAERLLREIEKVDK